MIWYQQPENDIVISTRIRLARNLEGVPFPNAMTDKADAIKKIKDAVCKSNSTLSRDFECIDLDQLSLLEKQGLAEKHLISFDMLNGTQKSVLISKDKTMSIMLMEEDHIRLQIILGGLALEQAWETASRVDDVIEESIAYAFDEELGYLTACPTNVGTGLRASVMLHLPALSRTGNLSRIISSAASLGLTVRGLYGEGSKAYGNLYQISNQITEGASEEEIIEKLKNVVNQIIDLEQQARKSLQERDSAGLADNLYRSYGALKYARSISSGEAKSLLSDVLLGQNMGIISERGKMPPIECMVKSEPALISEKKELSAAQRDSSRADMLRENI